MAPEPLPGPPGDPPPEGRRLPRRTFLGRAARAAGGLAGGPKGLEALEALGALPPLAGAALASSFLAGCTAPVRSFPAAPRSVVAVPLARFPELERPGGAVKVVLGDASLGERRAVFLRHDGEGAYRGFSAVCTHQGCLVDVTPQGFRCPCHGSLYDLDGRNAAGPARRPLAPFRAERRGDAVNLFLTSG